MAAFSSPRCNCPRVGPNACTSRTGLDGIHRDAPRWLARSVASSRANAHTDPRIFVRKFGGGLVGATLAEGRGMRRALVVSITVPAVLAVLAGCGSAGPVEHDEAVSTTSAALTSSDVASLALAN